MSDPWTAAIEEANAYAPADQHTIAGLELIHPQFVDAQDNQDSIRVALDNHAWDLEHEIGAPLFSGVTKRYEPLAMRISLPEQSENNLGQLDITLDNVPRSIWPSLRKAARIRASAIVIFRQWVGTRNMETGAVTVSGPPDYIVDQLTMKVVTATQLQLSGSAGFVDMLNKAFISRTYDRDDFPGLHGVSS